MEKSSVYSSMMNSRKLKDVNLAALFKTAGIQDRPESESGSHVDARTSMQDRRKIADRRRLGL